MRKQYLLCALLGSIGLAGAGFAWRSDRSPVEPVALRIRMVLAVPWGDQAGQVGRQNFPEAAYDLFPTDFCRAPDGTLWVCDGINNRLVGFRPDPNGEKPAELVAQVPLEHPTHVAASKEGLFIVDWPREAQPEGPLQCSLWHYADGQLQQKATFQDPLVGYLAGQLVALPGGEVLALGDLLHRVKPAGEVQEIPLETAAMATAVGPSGLVYQIEKWEREEEILTGRVKRWTLDSEEQEPTRFEVVWPYDTGPEMDPEWLQDHPSGARLIGADSAGRLYCALYERLQGGSPRLTLARFSPEGELLDRGYFQPPGMDLRDVWKRCPEEVWRVTAEGQLLVALPTDQEYLLLEVTM